LFSYLEPQYHILDEELHTSGLSSFGPMASYTWNSDPKRLLFVLSRYKFAARMLEGAKRVIEVGCGDGFAARIVRQHVDSLLLTDADPLMVAHAETTQSSRFPVNTAVHNFAHGRFPGPKDFDGVYLLDVLEHVSKQEESEFLLNIKDCLLPGAKIVIGMPSIESQEFASAGSRAGHVNCMTKEELYATVSQAFGTTFCFSMNDEVVHTGFSRMSNYIFAVATN